MRRRVNHTRRVYTLSSIRRCSTARMYFENVNPAVSQREKVVLVLVVVLRLENLKVSGSQVSAAQNSCARVCFLLGQKLYRGRARGGGRFPKLKIGVDSFYERCQKLFEPLASGRLKNMTRRPFFRDDTAIQKDDVVRT